MANNDRDDPGVHVPTPLIYLLPMLLGLLLDRRSHLPFLPRGVGQTVGWPLIGGGVALTPCSLRIRFKLRNSGIGYF